MSACFSSLMSAGILDRVCARVCVHVRACVCVCMDKYD